VNDEHIEVKDLKQAFDAGYKRGRADARDELLIALKGHECLQRILRTLAQQYGEKQ
jgi:hypothetical protein